MTTYLYRRSDWAVTETGALRIEFGSNAPAEDDVPLVEEGDAGVDVWDGEKWVPMKGAER